MDKLPYSLVVIFSFSIAIPAAILAIRFHQIAPKFYLFAFFVWIGLLNEIISYVVTQMGSSTMLNNNIYFLAEGVMLTCLFRSWGLFKKTKFLFPILLITILLFWTTEVLFFQGIKMQVPYFQLFYSFLLALMSADMINRQVTTERQNLLKNPIFLICITFVIYFTYSVILGSFWLYGLQLSRQFTMNLIAVLMLLNLFSNLVYALAALWIPNKNQYLMPY